MGGQLYRSLGSFPKLCLRLFLGVGHHLHSVLLLRLLRVGGGLLGGAGSFFSPFLLPFLLPPLFLRGLLGPLLPSPSSSAAVGCKWCTPRHARRTRSGSACP